MGKEHKHPPTFEAFKSTASVPGLVLLPDWIIKMFNSTVDIYRLSVFKDKILLHDQHRLMNIYSDSFQQHKYACSSVT